MTIVYFTIGNNLDMYTQVYLSIASFKKHLEPDDRVVAVTTNTEFFARVEWIDIILIDKKIVEDWKGCNNFFWRAKIKAIEKVATTYPEDDLLYLDCDTLWYGDWQKFKREVASGFSFMDGNEGHPSKIKYKPQRMYKVVGGKTYSGITIGEKHNMWCAGVVAIPAEKKSEIVSTALSLCDGMLADGAEPIVVEQYSLSIAMNEKCQLQSSKPYLAHYWGNKPQWIDIAKNLIVKSFFTNVDLLDEVSRFIESSIMKVPIYVKKHNTNKRLKSWVDKMFPDDCPKFLSQT